MRKTISIFLITILALTSCTTNKGAKQETAIKPGRFKYYKSIYHKTDTVEIQFIEWPVTDRPNFILESDYIKYNNNTDSDELLNHCFFLDTKDNRIQDFSKEITEDLQSHKAVRFYGEFFRTKQFDDAFPDKVFESMRTSNGLSYKPDSNGFKVFVYTKFERIK